MLLKILRPTLVPSISILRGAFVFNRIQSSAKLYRQYVPLSVISNNLFNQNYLNKSLTLKTLNRYKTNNKIEKENLWTIPNILCMSRIGITPYLGYLIINTEFQQAFYIMILAAVTDLLDGYIARNWYSQSTIIGSYLDPVADKILIVTLFTTMSYTNLIPTMLSVLIIARDIILIGIAFYIRYLWLPPPRNLSRYFDVRLATVQLVPTITSKFNTVVQLATVAVTLTASAFEFTDHPSLPCLWFLTATTTIASVISYLLSKYTYKILKSHSHFK